VDKIDPASATPWNMASWRSRTYKPPTARKVHAPVGETPAASLLEHRTACSRCGYHICSCPPRSEPGLESGSLNVPLNGVIDAASRKAAEGPRGREVAAPRAAVVSTDFVWNEERQAYFPVAGSTHGDDWISRRNWACKSTGEADHFLRAERLRRERRSEPGLESGSLNVPLNGVIDIDWTR